MCEWNTRKQKRREGCLQISSLLPSRGWERNCIVQVKKNQVLWMQCWRIRGPAVSVLDSDVGPVSLGLSQLERLVEKIHVTYVRTKHMFYPLRF